MRQFNITGMTCAACQARVEKAVTKLCGVTSCSVSLLTNSMSVEGDVSDSDIISAVERAGYGARAANGVFENDPLSDEETPRLRRRLLKSVLFLLALMYFSMGHMLGFPLPPMLSESHTAIGIIEFLLTLAVIIINRDFFVSGFKSAIRGAPNMDTLVALGASASFIWSVYALLMTATAHSSADAEAWMNELYFESAAMILTLITVGKMLEAKSKGKTTNALRSLLSLSPKTATVIRNGREIEIEARDMQIGDIFIVRPGESVPVDGIVIEGNTAVDESALTGESIPVDKEPGGSVFAATINRSGFIKCEATHVGEDTLLSQIIKAVSDAAATKAPIAKIADRVSGIFVPAVIGIAFVTFCIWMILGKPLSFTLARAISVLVISCPCALGLATPVAIMVGSGQGAKHGLLFKTAESLENAGKAAIVILDKTGTVTCGNAEVCGIFPAKGVSEAELLAAAYSLETKSEHPLARAVVRRAEADGAAAFDVTDFRTLPGNGISAMHESTAMLGGSLKFIASQVPLDDEVFASADAVSDSGATPLLFVSGEKLLGLIAVADAVKPDSKSAVSELERMGIRVVMLTGDNPRTARAVARMSGIENVIAGVLPDGKEAVVSELSKLGKVIMVGDGINDAPALTSADTGIAIGTGTDVAIDAADVVLVHGGLRDVPAAIRLSRATLKNIKENLFWAFIYNIIGIPLAAGCFIGIFGWQLNPMFGAAAMSLSSFCVVSNALRINLFDVYSSKRDRAAGASVSPKALTDVIDKLNIIKEEHKMTKTIKIDGMMCHHCEAHVKKALEATDGVESASASHTDGIARVTLSKDVTDAVLKSAVEEEGYTVISIE